MAFKKATGKQRPPIQVYFTIDKEYNIKHYIKIINKVFNATTDKKGRVTNTNIIYTGPSEKGDNAKMRKTYREILP